MPSIPRLDGEPLSGPGGEPLTMDEQAKMVGGPDDPRHPDYQPQMEMAPPHRTHQPLGGGVLTPQQAGGPGVMTGVGSSFPENQPFVQAPDGRRISQATLDQLNAAGRSELEQFQNQAEGTQKDALAGAAPSSTPQDEQVAKVMKDLGLDDPKLLEQIQEDAKGKLERKVVRDAIESRLQPISIEQMIDDGEARQEVIVVRPRAETDKAPATDGLSATFRTIQGHENLAIHRMMRGDAGNGVNYVRDRYLLLRLTAGMFDLNGEPLPSHLDQGGSWDSDLFAAKMAIVGRYALPMLSVLSINYGWFAERSEDVFLDVEGLKNG